MGHIGSLTSPDPCYLDLHTFAEGAACKYSPDPAIVSQAIEGQLAAQHDGHDFKASVS